MLNNVLKHQSNPIPRGKRMTGIDSGGDGVQSSWLVLVVDHGIITLCHALVTMSTDILGAKA